MFYFRAIYEAEAQAAGSIAIFESMKATHLKWPQDESVVGEEQLRSSRVKPYQGNENPFVLDTTHARRTFGNPSTGVQEGVHSEVQLRVYPSPARDVVTV
ncbi:MAG TPA: hypothetical protein VD948_00615, partial [Rhodothermales bacterium]|nr:hypothetical protein [Rhodothermales bacterium]